ncbi:MAG: hypothetical protein RJQ14_26170 [Marinoscillum sp.]
MRTIYSIINKQYLLAFLFFGSFYLTLAQIGKLEGYDVFLKNQADKIGLTEDSNRLESLFLIVLQNQQRFNQIVPLHFIVDSDTIVHMYWLNDLKKIPNKELGLYNYGYPIDISNKNYNGYKIDLPDRIDIESYPIDSIVSCMKSNMMVNTKNFDISVYVDENPTSFCCDFEDFSDRLGFIYISFMNGILLTVDDLTGDLHYMPY